LVVLYVGKDYAGNCATGNFYNEVAGWSDYAWFKFIVDNTAPTLTVSAPSVGTVTGSGTSTQRYTQSGASLTVTFQDNYYLYSYSSTSYYRYKWCTNTYASSSTCTAVGSATTGWTSINSSSGSRTSTKVYGTISVPSTSSGSIIYLWIEGDARDGSTYYMSNSVTATSVSTSSSSVRCFKFYVDNTTPTITQSNTGAWQTQYVANNTSNNTSATITDAHSGLSVSQRCIKKAGASSYTCYANATTHANSSYLASGVNYLYYYAKDLSGNVTQTSPLTLYIDSTNPYHTFRFRLLILSFSLFSPIHLSLTYISLGFRPCL
jgi:hypothetical protein